MRMIACILLALWGISSPANAQSAQQPAAIPVGVVTAERKPVTKTLRILSGASKRSNGSR